MCDSCPSFGALFGRLENVVNCVLREEFLVECRGCPGSVGKGLCSAIGPSCDGARPACVVMCLGFCALACADVNE
jgi:hypothetical protein